MNQREIPEQLLQVQKTLIYQPLRQLRGKLFERDQSETLDTKVNMVHYWISTRRALFLIYIYLSDNHIKLPQTYACRRRGISWNNSIFLQTEAVAEDKEGSKITFLNTLKSPVMFIRLANLCLQVSIFFRDTKRIQCSVDKNFSEQFSIYMYIYWTSS